jgi:hypothetical protein
MMQEEAKEENSGETDIWEGEADFSDEQKELLSHLEEEVDIIDEDKGPGKFTRALLLKWWEDMIWTGRAEILYDLDLRNKIEVIPFARRIIHTNIGAVLRKLKELSGLFHLYINRGGWYKDHGGFDEKDYRVLQATIIEKFVDLTEMMLPSLGAADATLDQISDDFTLIELELQKQAVPSMVRDTTVVLTIIAKEAEVEEIKLMQLCKKQGVVDIQKHILQGLRFQWIERDGSRIKWKAEKLRTFMLTVGEVLTMQMMPDIIQQHEEEKADLKNKIALLQKELKRASPKAKSLSEFEGDELADFFPGEEPVKSTTSEVSKLTEAITKMVEQQQEVLAMAQTTEPGKVVKRVKKSEEPGEDYDATDLMGLSPTPRKKKVKKKSQDDVTEVEEEVEQEDEDPHHRRRMDEEQEPEKEVKMVPCPECEGEGLQDGKPCMLCEGSGTWALPEDEEELEEEEDLYSEYQPAVVLDTISEPEDDLDKLDEEFEEAGEIPVVPVDIPKSSKKRRSLTKEEIAEREAIKQREMEKWNNIHITDDMYISCEYAEEMTEEAECKKFRKSEVTHGIERCFYQIKGMSEGDKQLFNCTMPILEANDINPDILFGDPAAIFQCEQCPDRFKTEKLLGEHIQHTHGECPHCGKKIENKKVMKGHIKVVHRKKAYAVCEECGFIFKDEAEYELLGGKCPDGHGTVEKQGTE